MLPTEIALTIISVFKTINSISFGYLAFRRNANSETKQIGRESGRVISDLGYIKSSIERIEKNSISLSLSLMIRHKVMH